FLEGCIEQTPDIYLSELQDELRVACGITVHEAFIVRALQWRGFSRKKVALIATSTFNLPQLMKCLVRLAASHLSAMRTTVMHSRHLSENCLSPAGRGRTCVGVCLEEAGGRWSGRERRGQMGREIRTRMGRMGMRRRVRVRKMGMGR
ncbi:hypothetical protein BS17DRAFT_706555, partial [Gyrodon lividus]